MAINSPVDQPADGWSAVTGAVAAATGVGLAIDTGVVSGSVAAVVGAGVGCGAVGCAAVGIGCRVGDGAGERLGAGNIVVALGAGVGVGVATTTGALGVGVGRLSGAITGPEVGVGRGLGRVDGGRLKRSRLGSVWGPLGVVCAAASAGSIAAPASHSPTRLEHPNPFIPITPTDFYLNRRQTRGGPP